MSRFLKSLAAVLMAVAVCAHAQGESACWNL
jgi:hypothetical protein